MKTVLLSLILSFPLFLNGDDHMIIDFGSLQKRIIEKEEVYFSSDKNEPFTGKSVFNYPNGKKCFMVFKNGKKDGKEEEYYPNKKNHG